MTATASQPSDSAALFPTVESGGGGYTVLARRYRSRNFDELIGQEPIARTLQNAIASGRTAHAYLFCGTRGVGKTSTARIFAKAMNVSTDLAEADAIANAILRGEDLDVIEIDAASNRGIDNARDLIANAGISPARCRYKIYIIDEVHALTKDAFNALLKIMEEPPSHVKFILCTTEAHKVPATIQSRCQRFDFRPISSQRIADQLRMILEKEGIEADEEVVVQVARLGHGSMRDALSLLDRLLAAGEKKLTTELLEQMVGMPDYALVSALVDAIVSGDAQAVLGKGDELITRGTSAEQALELLTEHFRSLMIISACGPDTEMLELSSEMKKAAESQATNFDTAALVHMIALCDGVARGMKNSAASRALFDAAIVRLALAEKFADVRALLGGQIPEITTTVKKKELKPFSHDARHGGSPARNVSTRDPAAPSGTASSTLHHVIAESKPPPDPMSLDGPAIWERVQQLIVNDAEHVKMKVSHLIYESCDGQQMTLSLDEEGLRMEKLMSQQCDLISNLIQRATGRTMKVRINGNNGAESSLPQTNTSDFSEVRSIPAVRQAIDIFDATVVHVENVNDK